MKTYASEDLAKEYEFETAQELYNYIVDSVINGQRKQAGKLFLQLNEYYKKEFLNDFLQDDNSYHTSTRKICIAALLD